MVFSRFFKKDAKTLAERGDKALQNGDFARAIQEFTTALDQMSSTECEGALAAQCRTGIQQAQNALAGLNLEEAQHHIRMGNQDKAVEHLELARSQCSDAELATRIHALLAEYVDDEDIEAPAPSEESGHSCGGCGSHSSCNSSHHEEVSADGFAGDRFELLISSLPGDLPERYHAMGDDFARAYLLSDEERYTEALPILGALPGAFDNDIILYEMAVIYHRLGKIDECDSLFRRVLAINPANPLGNLAFFHLLAETRRLQEGAAHLQGMISREILADQATFMLADLLEAVGQEEEAMKLYGEVLKTRLASEGAKRLVPLLQKQGREKEAKQLAKQYLKGCC